MSLANVRNAVFDQNADRVYVITPDVRILDVIEMIGDFWQLVISFPHSHLTGVESFRDLNHGWADSPCFLFSDLITKVRVRVAELLHTTDESAGTGHC